MKLISCHIENFGKLSDVDLSFEEGLNTILRVNGWGKSTLTAFLRAMFYGLNNDSKKDALTNERKKYAPWQGGAFGGSISFEADGKRYVATRFFDVKASLDSFELRDMDTNRVSSDYSQNLGEELFKINSESFMKTVYIGQNEASVYKATDDINAKLGNISDGMDLNKFEAADKILCDAINFLSPTRKTGEIYKQREEIASLKASIQRSYGINDAIKTVEKRVFDTKALIDKKKAELSELSGKKSLAAGLEKKEADKKQYALLCAEALEKELKINSKKEFFGGKTPKRVLMEELEALLSKLSSEEKLYYSLCLSQKEEEQYDLLLSRFIDGLAYEAEISAFINNARDLSKYRLKMQKFMLSKEEREQLSHFEERFDDTESVREDIEALISDWGNRNVMLSDKKNLERSLEKVNEDFSPRRGGILAIIISILLCVCGAGALIKGFNEYVCYAAIVAGAAGAIAGALYRKMRTHKKNKAAGEISDIKEQISAIEDDVEDIECDVEALLSDFDIEYDEKTAARKMQGLLLYIHEIEKLQEKANELDSDASYEVYEKISLKIHDYLLDYGIKAEESEYIVALTKLLGDTKDFESLSDKREKCVSSSERVKLYERKIRVILEDLGVDTGTDIKASVEDALDNYVEFDSLMALLEDVRERKAAFEKEHDMEALFSETGKEDFLTISDIEEREKALSFDIEELQNNLFLDSKTLDSYLEKSDALSCDESLLYELTESSYEKLQKYELIKKTQELLTASKDALTKRYMEPILCGFCKYYSILTNESSEDYRIDSSINLTKLEKGKQRLSEALSTGYRDLIGFCMRLSMADAMYPVQKPVLILDDPFVNLDDDKQIGAGNLLKKLSEEYQIIYMTCRKDSVY